MTTPPARLKPIHLPLHRGGFFGGARTQLPIRILRQPGIEASVETMKPPHPLAPLREGSCQRQPTEGSPNRLPLEGKVSAQPTDEVFFQRRIQIKQAEIASARPAAYSSVSAAVPNRAAAITVSVTASVRRQKSRSGEPDRQNAVVFYFTVKVKVVGRA